MTPPIETSITVGAPNWEPLEQVCSPDECAQFMYMGSLGEIELYKHCLTRRYLNIGRDTRRFYEYRAGDYVEISKAAALKRVRG